MTSTKDVHDMLGLTAEQVSQPKPKKKGKPTIRKPDGMAREVFSLLGERAPPIPLAEPKQYKAKRRLGASETAQWRDTPFLIPSRNDGLILRHWIKQPETSTANQPELATPVDLAAQTADTTDEADAEPLPYNVQASRNRNLNRIKQPVAARQVKNNTVTDDYKFSKYDIQAPRLTYDDTVYRDHLKTDEWSREETDRLMDLYSEYYGKWPIIVDRWDYSQSQDTNHNANGSSEANDITVRPRTMEELKSRFYHVSAKLMELKTPVSQMSATEFNNHEKMLKFDAKQEIERKRYKETVLSRSRSEKDEERLLLAELERMYKRQEQFEEEIRDLRQRLDHSLTDDIPNAQHYTTSQEITGLFQKMIQRDKNNKLRRPVTDPNATSSSPTMANVQNPPATATPASATNQAGNKRSSLANQSNAPGRRALSPGSEARFGITTHDRLTFGVSFKSDRIAKARQAKSQSKTEKIAALLSELGVPELIQIPTAAICSSMEDLVKKINILIDQRKIMEKQENDLKVARELKAQREGKPAEEPKPEEQQQQQQKDQQQQEESSTGAAAAQPDQSNEQQNQKDEEASTKEETAPPQDEVDESAVDESAAAVDEDGDIEVKDAPPASVDANTEDDPEGENEAEAEAEVDEEEDVDDDDEGDGDEDGDGEVDVDVDVEDEGEDEDENEDGNDEEEEEEEGEEEEEEDEEDNEDENENENADEPEPPKEADVDTETSRPSTRGNAATTRSSKRSASVLSEASTGSTKSRTSKRLKAARA